MSLISELGVLDLDEASIKINWRNFNETKPVLAEGLIRDADSFHEHEMVVQEEMHQNYGGERYRLRPYNLKETLSISSLVQGTYQRRIVQFRGVVTYVAQPVTFTMFKEYACKGCGSTREFEAWTLDEMIDSHSMPKASRQFYFCNECNHGKKFNERAKMPFDLVKQSVIFVPAQKFIVQDLVTEVGSGKTPASIECWVLDDLATDKIVRGEQITCVGVIYPTFHKAKQALGVYSEVVSIRKKLGMVDEVPITDDEVAKIKSLANDPEVYDLLIRSFDPSVYGYESIKLGLLCSLFGSPRVDEVDDDGEVTGVKVRGDINVLLVGDPGTSKSKMINRVGRISPRPVYASGSRATEAGLTVTWLKGENGLPEIRAGAAILADNGGIIVWDEVEKSTLETRNGIHKAMEDQFMPMTMAGVTQVFNTREPWVCAANPKKGRYSTGMTLLDNVDLDEPFLSRFDIIHVIRDEPTEATERPLADVMIEARAKPREPPIPVSLLQKYIAYAHNVNPEVDEGSEAVKVLKEGYLKMRLKKDVPGSIPPTPRLMQSLMRVALSLARMQLNPKLEVNHARMALGLMEESAEPHSLKPELANFMTPEQ